MRCGHQSERVSEQEARYLEIFLEPIRQCRTYQPKFGQAGAGVSFSEFKALYGADPFYTWLGLDNEWMYAAHRAAGGMTSIYRQIGIGCERLFRAILVDVTGYLDPTYATWSYSAKTRSGQLKKLALDGRLELSQIQHEVVRQNVQAWIHAYCAELGEVVEPKNGLVFEVRQGYKSKDSKRQNADIDNATVAWANSYLPVFAVFSGQIDSDLVWRYRNNRCGMLIGVMSDDTHLSLYAFCAQVLGYDLAGFFSRYAPMIKKEVHDVLETLLHVEHSA